jgi:hypothetical protein
MPTFSKKEDLLAWAQKEPPNNCYIIDMPRGMKKSSSQVYVMFSVGLVFS